MFCQRCLERLQESRAKLVDRFRHIDDNSQSNNSELVKEVMAKEWNLLQRENKELSSDDPLNYNPFSLVDVGIHLQILHILCKNVVCVIKYIL